MYSESCTYTNHIPSIHRMYNDRQTMANIQALQIYVHKDMQTHRHIHIHTSTNACMQKCVQHAHMPLCIHTCIHVYMHTYTHAYLRTCILPTWYGSTSYQQTSYGLKRGRLVEWSTTFPACIALRLFWPAREHCWGSGWFCSLSGH